MGKEEDIDQEHEREPTHRAQVENVLETAKRFLPISIILISTILAFLMAYLGVPMTILFDANPFLIGIALIFQLSSFLVLALRLKLVSNLIDVSLGWDVFLYKLAETFAAIVTPAAAGGFVLRAYYLKKNGAGWDRGMGVAWTTLFLDIAFNDFIGIIYSIAYFEKGRLFMLPVLIISIVTFLFYLLVLLLSNFPAMREKMTTFLQLFKIKIKSKNIEAFGSAFKKLVRKPFLLSGSIGLTFARIFFQTLAILFSAWALGLWESFSNALAFQAISHVMYGIPLPSGAGAVEYCVSIFAKLEVVVLWRFITFHLVLLACLLPFHFFTQKYVGSEEEPPEKSD